MAGAHGSATITLTLSDIAFGDGSNGIDLTFEAMLSLSATILGVSIPLPSLSVTSTANDIVDLDAVATSFISSQR